jgi:hypothetical protein
MNNETLFNPNDRENKVGDVIDWITERAVDGDVLTCPCCDQTIKIYERKFNAPMARILLIIDAYFQMNPTVPWLHVDDYLKNFGINCRYFSLIERWGLIEGMDGVRDDGSRRTGYWRITAKGRQFCRGEISVESFFLMYNQENYGFSKDLVTIHDCLGLGGFNYNEVMQAINVAEIAHQPRQDF